VTKHRVVHRTYSAATTLRAYIYDTPTRTRSVVRISEASAIGLTVEMTVGLTVRMTVSMVESNPRCCRYVRVLLKLHPFYEQSPTDRSH
jgi:hypothetical protein